MHQIKVCTGCRLCRHHIDGHAVELSVYFISDESSARETALNLMAPVKRPGRRQISRYLPREVMRACYHDGKCFMMPPALRYDETTGDERAA